jgi:sulfate adenylyltransferase
MADGTEHGLIATHGGTLNQRQVHGDEAAALEARRELPKRTLNARELSDLELLANGGLSPLGGFMTRDPYRGVVDRQSVTGQG